ncbi:MAG: Na(+)-translocating NADH-quinone reductase subunit A [Bacteroidales bacterium]|nr:Na(+)-translocating NADH-quinone reductase subunit A [Bacteroidales bacterium]
MVDFINIRKGLEVPVAGAPDRRIIDVAKIDTVAVKPTDFKHLAPKLMVKEGDKVLAGSVLFVDKARPRIQFTSPVSGTVDQIVRGDKRKLLAVVVKADEKTQYKEFEPVKVESASAEQIISALLESGLWPCIKQRPYGIIPAPEVAPKAIFVSGFHSAPLSSDLDFSLREELDSVQAAVRAFLKILPGGVHFGIKASNHASTPFHKLSGVKFHTFEGPHPAGNVGVQISKVCPIAKGDVVWTVDLHLMAVIGRFLLKGIVDMSKIVAVGGPMAKTPGYVKGVCGMSMKNIGTLVAEKPELSLQKGQKVRFVSGSPLTGTNVGEDGYLGFYDDSVSLLSEGNYNEWFGWAKIFRPKKFSFSRGYFSWLTPRKKYAMDTNTNGGVRAFVLSGYYDKVFPMDIYPVYLLKACLAGDIEKMEQLGIYEVVEEDFALCDYICPSKIECQKIISDGIDLMLKEME